jgi:hypothetical protein
MSHHLFRLLMISLVVIGLPSLLNAETYRDAANHFQLELPEGWRALTADELSQVNKVANLGTTGAKTVAFHGGIRPTNKFVGSYYYVIHPGAYCRASYEDIEKDIVSDGRFVLVKVECDSIEQMLKSLAPGQASLDRKRNLFCWRAQKKSFLWISIDAYAVYHLGSTGCVQILGGPVDDEDAAALPIFAKFNESFRFDPEYQFTTRTSTWTQAGQDSRTMVAVILLMVVACGLAGFVLYLVRRHWTSPGARVNDFARAFAMSGVAFLVSIAVLGSDQRIRLDGGGLIRYFCAFCLGGLIAGFLSRNRNWSWIGVGVVAFLWSLLLNFGISFLIVVFTPA